ncbi:MAG: nitroreductase [Gemmatimonadales bacterium]
MDAIEAIQRRTSVRRFRPDPISRETLERLLDASTRAPNHRLTEPWRFAVLTGGGIARLAELRAQHRLQRFDDPGSAEALAAGAKMRRETAETPAVVVVMCKVSADENTREEDYAATMMAIGNLMIAAESIGLGTYLKTGGIMREPGMMELAGLAPEFRIAGLVSLGIPAEPEVPRKRRPASELTTWIDR